MHYSLMGKINLSFIDNDLLYTRGLAINSYFVHCLMVSVLASSVIECVFGSNKRVCNWYVMLASQLSIHH